LARIFHRLRHLLLVVLARLRHRRNVVRAWFRRRRLSARAWKRQPGVVRATSIHRAASLPLTVLFLFSGRPIPTEYGMTWPRRFRLALRMHRNTKRVLTYTSYKSHLAMAVKLLEIPPAVVGDVVECGCFRGGSTANLSLICEIVGRKLIVYDSFEGLPAPQAGDRYATAETEGFLSVSLDEVRENVRRLGAVECCEFRKGWFEDTLPDHDTPIVMCFLDVDYQASLRDCVLNLWPHLTERGYVFIDEYMVLDYGALFFSEKFWDRYFDRPPPGMFGIGAGVGVGEYYLGPRHELPRYQEAGSVAYTRKDFDGHWDFYPEDLRS
jgi:hypothetical protein